MYFAYAKDPQVFKHLKKNKTIMMMMMKIEITGVRNWRATYLKNESSTIAYRNGGINCL
jgi:uncharacterized pyridoxamine 5'-phosphate oxidase family protein